MKQVRTLHQRLKIVEELVKQIDIAPFMFNSTVTKKREIWEQIDKYGKLRKGSVLSTSLSSSWWLGTCKLVHWIFLLMATITWKGQPDSL
jgi:hypothetical protein